MQCPWSDLSPLKSEEYFVVWNEGKVFKLGGNGKSSKGTGEHQLVYFTFLMTSTNSRHPPPLWLCLDNNSSRNLEKGGFIIIHPFKKKERKQRSWKWHELRFFTCWKYVCTIISAIKKFLTVSQVIYYNLEVCK